MESTCPCGKEELIQHGDDAGSCTGAGCRRPKIAILHHADADGFGAAFAAHAALKDRAELLFEKVQYGEKPPFEKLREFAPDQIYILDFSYKAPVLKALMVEFNTVVIDHHKSAAEDLLGFADIHIVSQEEGQLPILSGVRVLQENSGCVLAWMFFNPGVEIPEILLYVQDRDLWKWELEHSEEINAYIATMPEEFEAWSEFFMPLAYDAGKAVMAFQQAQVKKRVEAAELIRYVCLTRKADGVAVRQFYPEDTPESGVLLANSDNYFNCFVPIVCCTDNASEVGNDLLLAFPEAPFSVTYADRPNGTRSYSLRARGDFDVSEVAKAFGGGGHFSAAGWSSPRPGAI